MSARAQMARRRRHLVDSTHPTRTLCGLLSIDSDITRPGGETTCFTCVRLALGIADIGGELWGVPARMLEAR